MKFADVNSIYEYLNERKCQLLGEVKDLGSEYETKIMTYGKIVNHDTKECDLVWTWDKVICTYDCSDYYVKTLYLSCSDKESLENVRRKIYAYVCDLDDKLTEVDRLKSMIEKILEFEVNLN